MKKVIFLVLGLAVVTCRKSSKENKLEQKERELMQKEIELLNHEKQ